VVPGIRDGGGSRCREAYVGEDYEALKSFFLDAVRFDEAAILRLA
jgi:hypothetical protein